MGKTSLYLGVDVGSVSTNLVLINGDNEVVDKLYLRTSGQPINALRTGMKKLADKFASNTVIRGVGTTGSGRQLAGVIIGADVVKNEITTHAVAAQMLVPDVRTILEIGGQDSKIIILKNGVIYDFAMNTVLCSRYRLLLRQQAARLEILPIEDLELMLKVKKPGKNSWKILCVKS